MSAENRAYERSSPGTGPAPKYLGPQKDAREGWRVQTPPIVTSLTETLQQVEDSQGRSDNRTPS